MSTQIGEAVLRATGDTSSVVKSLRDMANQMEQTASAANASGSKVSQAFSKIGTAVNGVGQQFNSAINTAVGFSKSLLLVNAGLGAVIVAGVKSASELEQNRIAFETMLGSAQAAKDMLADLSNFSLRTPFTLPDVVQGARQLLAYGITAKSIIPDLEALGNIAAGVGKDKLPFLTLAFGQVATKGKLQGQEIRQFTEAGVPMLQVLAEQLGKTTNQIQDMSEKGQISFADVENAIKSMSSEGGKFFGLMARQSTSLSGIWSNVKDSVGFALRTIIGVTNEGEVRAGSAFDIMRKGAAVLFDWLAKLKNITPELATKITSIVGAVLGAAASFLTLIAVFKVVMLLMNPFMLLFAAFAAIVGVKVYGSLQKLQTSMHDSAKATTDMGGTVVDQAGKAGKAMDSLSSDTIKKLKELDDQMAKTTRDYLRNLKDIITGKQDEVSSVKKSMADEKAAYDAANAQLIADNEATMSDIEDRHKEKVASIQQDLNAELLKGSKADQQRIYDLTQSLDKENTDYEKSKNDTAKKFEETTAKAKTEYEKRQAENQAKLDEDAAFLQKHEDDLATIRDVATLDEVQLLKEKYAEARQQYQQDKADALSSDAGKLSSAQSTGAGISQAASDATKAITDAVTNTTSAIGDAFAGVGLNVGDLAGKFDWLKEHIDLVMSAIVSIIVSKIAIGLIVALWPTFGALSLLITGIILAIGGIVIAVATNWDRIKGFFINGIEWIKTNWGTLAFIITGPFAAAFAAIATLWNKTLGKLNVKIPDWVPGIGGKEWGVPEIPIPKFKDGVDNFKGGLAYVHQGEVLANLPRGTSVIPKDKASGLMSSNISITFTGDITNQGEHTAQELADMIGKQLILRRNGAF